MTMWVPWTLTLAYALLATTAWLGTIGFSVIDRADDFRTVLGLMALGAAMAGVLFAWVAVRFARKLTAVR